ncbi:UNVERIFIED_CONTAM: hypothetical protein Sindi_1873500 [Sesamum indicum]
MGEFDMARPRFRAIVVIDRGYYNELLWQHEKTSGNRPWWQIQAFYSILQHRNLADLGYEGHRYTWWNKRESPHTVRAQLDWACANPIWQTLCPKATVTHLPLIHSNHYPLLISLDQPSQHGDERKKLVRFEAMGLTLIKCAKVRKYGDRHHHQI